MTDTNFTFNDLDFESAIEKLQDLKERRRDVVARFPDLGMTGRGDIAISNVESDSENNILVTPNELAHRQIATRLNIPFKYWNRMRNDIPALAATNFNAWLAKEREDNDDGGERKVLVRSYMDKAGGNIGTMRALLSNSYLPIDNLSLIVQIIEVMKEMHDQHGTQIKVSKCSLSDTKLYLKFVSPTIRQDGISFLKNYKDPNNGQFGGLGTDNGIVSGFVVTNSEVGVGSLRVSPMITFKACMNNMIWKDAEYSRRHVGERMDVGIYAEDTKRSNLETIKLQIRDNVRRFLDPEFLGQQVKHIEEMAARRLENPIECTKNMAVELGLRDEEINSVLNNFLRQGTNESVFDVAQAITAFAHGQPAERKVELETGVVYLMDIADKCDVAPVQAN